MSQSWKANFSLVFLLQFFVFLSFLDSQAYASESNIVVTDNVKAQLISEHSTLEAGSTFSVLLKLDIRDKWHTYWRNPGDSGQATSLKWILPEGVSAGEIEWPYPEREYVGPVANYGYHGVALHKVQLTLDKDWPVDKPLNLVANATWLVCKEECIPEKGAFDLELPVDKKAQIASQHTASFERIETLLPTKLSASSSYQYGENDSIRFDFGAVEQLVNGAAIEYFPHEWGVTQPPAEQITVIDESFVSITTTKGDLSLKDVIAGVVVVTDKDGAKKAYEVESALGSLMTGGPDSASTNLDINSTEAGSSMSLISALFSAMLGGLILNLMPCVFPVLSMKAISLVNHASQSPAVIRKHGWVYTIGVLVSFSALGIALMIVKGVGHQIGWGFQLQSPLFVGAIVIVLFVLGLSLSGFVEIGTSMMGTGSDLAQHSGYKGSFFTGVLAVIVATPCTAPFMGPAVGYALTQPSIVTLAILLALGFGLALPYLMLCYFPFLSNRLPKPGLWMQKLQQFLAFPMYATAAWLVWVFGLQAGINNVLALLIACILIALAIWLWQNTKRLKNTWLMVGRISTAAVTIAAIGLLLNVSRVPTQAITQTGADHSVNYEAFSVARLDELQKANSGVFVNMTAAWCITCLANEKVALSTDELKAYFKEKEITYLKGDWTNQDPSITKYLESFGRSSVPLYVYYSGRSSKQQVLPQILTAAVVIEAIEGIDATDAIDVTEVVEVK